MTHERAYSLRWLHVIGPATVFVVLYAYYLAPILSEATGEDVFLFLDEWIWGIIYFWTDNRRIYNLLGPGDRRDILGIEIDSMFYFGWGWMVLVALAAGLLLMIIAGMVLLRSIRDKEQLPAHRPLGVPENVVIAMVWGTVALAVFCLALGHFKAYEKFNWLFLDQNLFNLRNPSMHLLVAPFVIAFITFSTAIWFIRQFFQKRSSQFWRLEKVTFRLMIPAVLVIGWSKVFRDDLQSQWMYTTQVRASFDSAEFLALLVLFWAWTCRVILLFHFARFKRESLLNPDSSCFACGYDLRESRHQPSCPECGAAIPVLKTPPPSHGPDH